MKLPFERNKLDFRNLAKRLDPLMSSRFWVVFEVFD